MTRARGDHAEASGAGAGDDAAREQATDPRASIVLQAPAGSGKTSVLTQRILRLLAEVQEPEEILAITFTRRAAAQMRERVLEALTGHSGSGPLAERLKALAAPVLERSARRGWRLEQDPGRLRIQTIDSFNLHLAQRLPLAARAGGALLISARPEEQYRQAARETLLSAERDPQRSADIGLWFERLDNKWGNVQRMLADMLKVRAHWLPHLLGQPPEALGRRVGETLAQIVGERLQDACACFDAGVRSLAAQLPGVGPLGCAAQALPAWKALTRLALTDKSTWRQRIDRRLGEAFASPGGKAALRACIDAMSAVPGARERLLELAALPPPGLSESDSAALAALARVLCEAAAQLEIRFALEGRVDYTRIAGAARLALTEDGQPTDLALRAGLSLRHILVDEFQDTSAAQTQLLEALTAGWEEGDGRTLFVVGDPMQSIYMFREAEVGCFLRVRDQGIGPIRLRPLRLTRNFRSEPALLEWINTQFGPLFPAADGLRESAVRFTASAAGRPLAGGGEWELRLFSGADRRAETLTVLERIVALKTRDPRASIAVLVAARRHAGPIIRALHGREVDAIGVELVPLREVPVVRDFVALTRALYHPGDRTAWLAVLRAPWCGASLASLTPLSRRNDTQLVWESLNDPTRLEQCPRDDRVRLERLRDTLARALAQRTRLPAADWLEQAWLALGGADAYPAQDLPHARAFLEAVSERVAAGEWAGAASLDGLLAGLFARPQSRTAHPVQVLTIHRAKGLEFDHVIIAGLDRRLDHGGEPLLRWLDLPRQSGPQSDLLLAPAAAVGDAAPGELGPYLKRLQERRAANEQVRLLYVAATRAKRSLHLYAVLEARADGSYRPSRGTLLETLWPVLGGAFRDSLRLQPAGHWDAIAAPAQPALSRLVAGWHPPPLPPPPQLERLPLGGQSLEPLEFSWARETSRHIGTVVHAALQAFARAPPLPGASSIKAREGFYRDQLHRHGVAGPDLTAATARVLEALTRAVEDERGRWILAGAHREARSELALTGLVGGRLANVIIDRCFVDAEGTRWVVDFKTSPHEGGRLEAFLEQEVQRYRGQLTAYAALARGLGAEPVRAGLYFPLLGVFREVRV